MKKLLIAGIVATATAPAQAQDQVAIDEMMDALTQAAQPGATFDPGNSLGEMISAIGGLRENALARAQAFGAMMHAMDTAEGELVKARRAVAAFEAQKRPPTAGELLFADFGTSAESMTAFQQARAAVQHTIAPTSPAIAQPSESVAPEMMDPDALRTQAELRLLAGLKNLQFE